MKNDCRKFVIGLLLNVARKKKPKKIAGLPSIDPFNTDTYGRESYFLPPINTTMIKKTKFVCTHSRGFFFRSKIHPVFIPNYSGGVRGEGVVGTVGYFSPDGAHVVKRAPVFCLKTIGEKKKGGKNAKKKI